MTAGGTRRPRRAPLVEEDDLGSGVAPELECQKREQHVLDGTAGQAGPPPAFGRLSVEARLEGSLQSSARGPLPGPLRDSVQLALVGSATPAGFKLDSLSLQAGRARLEGRADLQRQGPGWRSEGRLTLADFDPALWLPGDRSAAWRRAGDFIFISG